MAPLTVNHAAPAQQTANLPVYSTNYGAMDGNKTFQSAASFNTERDTREKQISSSLKAL